MRSVKAIFTACLLVMLFPGIPGARLLAAPTNPAPPVTLAWSPSPDTTVVGYNLYYGEVAGTQSNLLDSGPALTATVSNLQAGVTYFFFATAYDAAAVESEPSNVITYTPVAPSLPDLVVSSLQVLPSPLYPGEPAQFQVSVLNQGAGAVPAGSSMRVTFAINGQTASVWNDFTNALLPGASVTVLAGHGSTGQGVWVTTEGSHTILATVDALGTLGESDEANNQLQMTVPVQPAPLPLVWLSVDRTNLTENDFVGALVTLSRSGGLPGDLTVNLDFAGTAQVGLNVAALPAMLAIPSGQASVSFPLLPLANGVVDEGCSLVVSLAAGMNYQIGTPSSATLQITNSDQAPDPGGEVIPDGDIPVTLAWSPSPDSSVVGYNLYYGEVGGSQTNKLDVGPALTATVSNLQAGVTYFFFATAYDAAGVESEPSNLITHTPQAVPPPDTTAPIVTIDTPVEESVLTNSQAVVSGSASDDRAVAEVRFQLNQGAWQAVSGSNDWNVTVTLLPGTNALRAYAVDLAGNRSETNSVSVIYHPPDTTAPLVTIIAPVNGAQLSNSVVTILGSASDDRAPGAVLYQLNSGSWQSLNGLSDWSASVSLADGNNVIRVYAQDAAGNRSATNSVSVTYYPPDVTAPVVVIATPTNNAALSNAVATISGSASDNGIVSSVFYQLNNAAWQTASGSSNWSANVSLADGNNVIRVYAQDAAGNRSATNSVNVIYYPPDVTAPVVVIATPTNNAALSNAVATVSGSAIDNGNVAGVFYRLNNAAWQAASGSSNWSASVTLADGNNVIRVYAQDAAGNRSATNSVSVTYYPPDVTAPVVVIATPTNNAALSNAVAAISGSASDNGVVASVFYQLNNAAWQTASGFSNWSASVTLADGNNVIRVYAQDAAGNRSATNSVNVIYYPPDVTAPVVVIATPTNNAALSNAVATISGSASDNGVVASVFYQLNNVTWQTASGSSNWSANVNLAEGGNVIRVYAQDAASNRSATNSVNVIYYPPDVTAPVVVIATPTNNAALSNAVATISGSASDNGVVASVFYQLNAAAWQTANGSSNWSASVTLAEGGNVIRVYAQDAAGNRSATNSVSVTYYPPDVTAPVVVITTPTNNAALSNAVATVSGSASDNGNVTGVFYRLNNAAWQAATGTNNWSASVTLAEGGNVIRVYAQDAAGNRSATNSVNVIYYPPDVTAPVVVIATPTNNAALSNAVATVSGSASDNGNVTGVFYQLNNAAWQAATGTNNWSANVNLVDGGNVIRVYAQDAAGNRSATNSVNVTYYPPDVTAPVVVIATPTNNAALSNAVATISGSASDNGVVASVFYQLNAAAWQTASGSSNWSANVNLVDGGNVIRVYAQDAAGNRSATNSVSVTYYPPDTVAPVVVIGNPSEGVVLSNAVAVFSGYANDNGSVTSVFYQFNDAAWQSATGASNWSANVTLSKGANQFRVYAVDAAGNRSMTNSRSVTYYPPPPTVSLTLDRTTVTESDTNGVLITLYRTGDLDEDLTVSLSIGGSARSGVDYVSLTNQVIIQSGMNAASFPLWPLRNGTVDSGCAVLLSLREDVSYQTGSPSNALIQIFNDEIELVNAATGTNWITLTWSAGPETVLFGYNVYYHTGVAGMPTNKLDVGSALTATISNLQAGVTYFFAVASHDDTGGESKPSNVVTFTPEIPQHADLLITEVICTPFAPVAGSEVQFCAVVTNRGLAEVPTGANVRVRFSLLNGPVIGWCLLNSALRPGGSALVVDGGSPQTNLWIAVAGAHTIVAAVDDLNSVAESDENNNQFTMTLTVAPPPPPEVSVAVESDSVAENDSRGVKVAVYRTGNTNSQLSVALQYSGTARSGIDYQPLPASVIIPAGVDSTIFTLRPLLNGESGVNRQITISLLPAPDFQITPPTNATVLIVDQEVDADGDGMSNAAEAVAGTDPHDPDSSLKMLPLSQGEGGQLIVSWASVPGVQYEIMGRESLAGSEWVPVSTTVTATGPVSSWSVALTNPATFFSVRVVPVSED